MRIKSLKYFLPFIFFITGAAAMLYEGWIISVPLLLAWVAIPVLELLIKPDPVNMEAAEEEMAKADRMYDLWLYLTIPAQYLVLFLFVRSIQVSGGEWGWTNTGRLFVMGLLCGSFGINVAHELGHRTKEYEQTFSKFLLLTSLYMHFFIEHNKGHHKKVSTPEDPATARFGESVYRFYLRSMVYSWLSAWSIAARDLRKKGLPAFHWKNEMLQFQVIQVLFVGAIGWLFGWMAALYFMGAALLGALMLETVNYIEHYGLLRKKTEAGTYERTLPQHSWNSDHVLGRLVLFELSRHSDHHYSASRKYQVLRHHEEAPQMPTGYPGMMILSLFPPLWFRVMDRRIIVSRKEV